MTNLEELNALYEKAYGTGTLHYFDEYRGDVGNWVNDMFQPWFQNTCGSVDVSAFIIAVNNAFPALQREMLAGRKLAEAVRVADKENLYLTTSKGTVEHITEDGVEGYIEEVRTAVKEYESSL